MKEVFSTNAFTDKRMISLSVFYLPQKLFQNAWAIQILVLKLKVFRKEKSTTVDIISDFRLGKKVFKQNSRETREKWEKMSASHITERGVACRMCKSLPCP